MAGAALRSGEQDVAAELCSAPDSRARSFPPAHAPLEFGLAGDVKAFEALEPEWTELFERAGRSAQLFQTFNWNWHWCRHYLPGESSALAIITGRLSGRLVLVWPLLLERTAGLRILSWMGAPVSQYGDVLIDDSLDASPLLREACSFIFERLQPDLVWLRKVRADAVVAPVLSEFGAIETLRLQAPYIDLAKAGDFEAHLQRRSARFRKRQRGAAKRLAALGSVVYRRHTHGTEAADRARHAINLKRAQLSADGIYSPAVADPRMAAFFADIATAQDRPVGLNIDTVSVNGDLAAINMFIGCQDRAALHVVAYDLRFEKASVGSLLLQHTIGEAHAAGYRTFDFLAPGDAYKQRWSDGIVAVSDWAIPLSWKGQVFARAYLGLARPLMKSVFGALPLALRRFITDRSGGSAHPVPAETR